MLQKINGYGRWVIFGNLFPFGALTCYFLCLTCYFLFLVNYLPYILFNQLK